MYVTGWFVEGFGILNAFETRGLPPGLTVLEGPNEAGKSTLLAFIRGVLFGFPRAGRGRRQAYPPLCGGQHGGRVFVRTSKGELTLQRDVGRAPRITMGDGSELSDAEFQQLIGGVDEQTFRTVFAFSLDELRDFESLTGEQVRSRIFAAGVGGAGPSVREVVQQLEKNAAQLLKPRAREAEINRLLARLVECERALTEARLLSGRYPQLREEEDAFRLQLERLDGREHELRAAVSDHDRLIELWPIWVDGERSLSRLAALEVVDEFVPEPIRRLTEAKQGLEAARQVEARLEEQARRRSTEAAELRAGLLPDLEQIAPMVERQVARLPFYRERLQEREEASTRLRLDEERLLRALADLGPAADEAKLSDADTSLPRSEEIRIWRRRSVEVADRVKQSAERLDAATDARMRAEADRDRQREGLSLMEAPDASRLDAQTAALRSLRSGLADTSARKAALEAQTAATEATRQLLGVRLGEPAPRSADRARGSLGRGRLSIARMALIALGVLFIAGAIAVGLTGRVSLLVGLAVVGALALIAALSLPRFSPSATTVPAMKDLFEHLEAERREQEQKRESIARLEAGLVEAATDLGVSAPLSADELDSTEARLGELARQMVRWQDQKAELERVEQRLEGALQDEEVASARLQQAAEERVRHGDEFAGLMDSWGFPRSLSPEGAEEYLRVVRAAKEYLQRRDETKAMLRRVADELVAWEEETGRLLAFPGDRAGPKGPESAGAGTEVRLLALGDLCNQQSEIRRRLTALEEALAESRAEAAEAEKDLERRSRGWEALLAEAAVPDESGFLERMAVFEERQKLKQELAEREDRLVKRIGRGADAVAFREVLATGTVDLWEERLGDLARQLDELKRERADLIKLQGDLERRRRELEQSADVPAVEIKLEGLRTELEAALHRWRVYSLAAVLVRDTLGRFTRERQPLVLAEASRMFELVTAGRYERVLRSPDEEGIIVIDADGRVKTPEELSRGAVEQLYLCLRLGLAEEFSRRAEPIPLVMDDVLVNFDPVRRRATARLLLEFSKRHQVMLFTCHPEIGGLFREQSPETHVVKLS